MMTTSQSFKAAAAVVTLSLTLLAGCGSSDEALTDAESSASSVLDDGAISNQEADVAVDAATDAAEGTSIEDLRTAVGDDELVTLFTALEVAGFDDIAEAENFTFFAPNDGAFAAIDTELLGELLADPEQLRDILQDHLVDAQIFAADIPADGTVTTTGGLELIFDLSGDQPTVNGIPIERTDVTVDDRGVIHVIDGLLLEN